jgi:hypothetical protein
VDVKRRLRRSREIMLSVYLKGSKKALVVRRSRSVLVVWVLGAEASSIIGFGKFAVSGIEVKGE